jgi:hypothetical protein
MGMPSDPHDASRFPDLSSMLRWINFFPPKEGFGRKALIAKYLALGGGGHGHAF